MSFNEEIPASNFHLIGSLDVSRVTSMTSAYTSPPSTDFDASELHHLGPLLGFFGDELTGGLIAEPGFGSLEMCAE
jgi:hypothetical protein